MVSPFVAATILLVMGHAQPADDTEAAPAWIVELLDADDWSVRQGATEMLAQDRAIGLRQLETILRNEDLSAEARLRLETIARERFMNSPRAAVGMSWQSQSSPRFGVVVASLEDGFDAARVLRVGDRIVEAQGRPVRDWDRFRAQILSNDPGEVFPVQVVRDGVTRSLEFKLGSYARLNSTRELEVGLLEEAWQVRASSFTPEDEVSGATVDTGFESGRDWNLAKAKAQSEWRFAERNPSDTQGVDPRRGVRPGDRDEPTYGAGHQGIFDWGQVRSVLRTDEPMSRDMMTQDRQLAVLQDALRTQIALRAEFESRLENPDLAPEQRRYLTDRIQTMSSGIENLQRWLREIEGAPGDGGS